MVKPNHPTSLRESLNISRLAIRYSRLTICFWIGVMVAGIFAFSSLKYALFPDITYPVVVVNASAPFTTAVETETKLTKPLEQRLRSLEGLDEINSSTYPGETAVSVSFAVGTNLEESTRKVQTSLKQVTLTKGATFKIIPLNLNESAAISYAIESPKQSLTQLTKLAKDKIVPEIAKLPGVLKVVLLGDQSASANQKTATAALQQAATLVRFDGKDALAFQVIKRGNANTLEVVSQVEKQVQKLRATLPNVQIKLAATQAEYIRNATQATIDSLIEAVVVSVIVIFPFLLNWQATLISALAIPTSLFGTLIVMAIYGFNLETITLLALALVIGSIIDDAIVDVENIIRHVEKGESPRKAALAATNEIGLTVTAATLTAVAVFLPVGFMGGAIGQFFKPFGITIAAAMLISLLVARTLSPVLAIYWLKPKPSHYYHREGKLWLGFTNFYQNLLHWSLSHRAIVMGLAVLSLAGGIALIQLIPKGFIPKLDRGEFNIIYTAPLPSFTSQGQGDAGNRAQQLSASSSQSSIQNITSVSESLPRRKTRKLLAEGKTPSSTPGSQARQFAQRDGQILPEGDAPRTAVAPQATGSTLSQIPYPLNDSLQVAKKLEAAVRKYPIVETVFTVVGSREGEPNKGKLYVKLKSDRQMKTSEFEDQLRSSLPSQTGVTTSVEDISFVDTGEQKPLEVALKGNDIKALSKAAKAIKARIEKLPGFVDVTVTGVADAQNQIFQIERQNHQRVAYIRANLGKNLSVGDATDKLVAQAKTMLPPGISFDLGGDSARSGEVFSSFGTTLLLSTLCIIVVLIGLFKSWVDPVAIGISLPLALVGAMLALLFTKSDFGMISLIGFVFLLGLSNKNAILIVDYINQLRRIGLNRTDAILKAGPVRLRPIMMTTAATILGMVPIALGLGAGSELRSPMAIAIAGGLISSTILSLIVVPVVYTLLDDLFPRKRFKSSTTYVK
ncbi:MAG: efflux RND transporter permease subunit [Rhizonema sp. PD38]|nr:efflux RND transporter permease subunit [Rhizonema sp. PD38]